MPNLLSKFYTYGVPKSEKSSDPQDEKSHSFFHSFIHSTHVKFQIRRTVGIQRLSSKTNTI